MSVVERLILRADGVEPTLRRVETRVQSASRAVGGLARGAGALSVAMLAAGAAAMKLGQQLADRINDVTDFASRTGLAADTVAGLRLAAEGSGTSLSAMESVIRGLQRTMAQTGDIRSMDVAIRDVGAQLAEIRDPSERARRAIELLGRSGGLMIQALGDRGLQDFIDRADRFGSSTGPAAAEAAGRWQRAIADLRLVMEPAGAELLQLGSRAIEGFTIGLVAAKTFADELKTLLVSELASIPREIMASPFGVFMSTLFSDPVALFTGAGFSSRLATAAASAIGAARAPMDSDEALELALGPSYAERLADGWARAVDEARAFALGMGGGVGAGGVGGPGGADPFAAIRASGAGGSNRDTIAQGEAMQEALDANLAMMTAHADAMNAEQQRIAEGARMAAMMLRESYVEAFGAILGAAAGFANKNLALHKALGIAQVAVSTAIGIARAMELGFPAAIPAGIAAAANGAAQLAAIASTSMGSASMAGSMSGGAGNATTDAMFAPAGADTGGVSTGGGQARSVVRIETVGGYARVRDFVDELGRAGVALRLEGV